MRALRAQARLCGRGRPRSRDPALSKCSPPHLDSRFRGNDGGKAGMTWKGRNGGGKSGNDGGKSGYNGGDTEITGEARG